MKKNRNDGKTSISFRIPLELEEAFHKYCVNRDDRITKSEVFIQLIYDFLGKKGVVIPKLESPKASEDIYK
jgi:hypothetical protein